MEVLGWEIDTVAMKITLPTANLAKLRDLLREWPVDRIFASEKEVPSLLGNLLHACEVVRAGKFFRAPHDQSVGLAPGKYLAGMIGLPDAHGLD